MSNTNDQLSRRDHLLIESYKEQTAAWRHENDLLYRFTTITLPVSIAAWGVPYVQQKVPDFASNPWRVNADDVLGILMSNHANQVKFTVLSHQPDRRVLAESKSQRLLREEERYIRRKGKRYPSQPFPSMLHVLGSIYL